MWSAARLSDLMPWIFCPVQSNLGEPNRNEALAVDARQELDLKVWNT